MHLSPALCLAASLLSTIAGATQSDKRGLVFVPNPNYPADNQIWVEYGSGLTWYYNYGIIPSPAYSNRSQSEFEFVPMLWTTSDTFLSSIKSLVASGVNITHVLAYNEPDGSTSTGGSNIAPAVAAENWISQIEPLRKMGIKVGAPAVTGSYGGFTWLEDFFGNCTLKGTNCTADFIPVHWYGNFEGLASHIGHVYGVFNKTLWVTEYALNDADLKSSQNFYTTSAEYFDRLPYVQRYSYFGSFRSSVSNVGPNAAMLDSEGRLTDIGSWYLGGGATNNIPSKTPSKNAPKSNFATTDRVNTILGIIVVVAAGMCWL